MGIRMLKISKILFHLSTEKKKAIFKELVKKLNELDAGNTP